MLRPFVFRRYIDFSVIQSLRNMKGMIAREVRRRGLTGRSLVLWILAVPRRCLIQPMARC